MQPVYFLSLDSDRLPLCSWKFYSYSEFCSYPKFLDCSFPYVNIDKYVQGNFNLGMYDSYQAEMSFPLVAANPCICQGTLWVCNFLD